MEKRSRYALKEWAVVERAILSGRQDVLLRKGGLIDGPAGFQAQHDSFFIYPTFHHQQRDGLKKPFLQQWREISRNPPPQDQLTLSLFVEVREVFRIKRLEDLRELDARHILNGEEIKRRFYYGRVPGLNVLYVKAFTLQTPRSIPVLPHFAGCRSWVDLGVSVQSEGFYPVTPKAPIP